MPKSDKIYVTDYDQEEYLSTQDIIVLAKESMGIRADKARAYVSYFVGGFRMRPAAYMKEPGQRGKGVSLYKTEAVFWAMDRVEELAQKFNSSESADEEDEDEE